MRTFLDTVKEKKKIELTELKVKYKSELDAFSYSEIEDLSFISSLRRNLGDKIKIISEIKPRSPSTVNLSNHNSDTQGMTELDIIKNLANEYNIGGASAFSILTDKEYFGGSYEYIKTVRESFTTPILHKEFIIDPLQLILGKLMGANAALILTYYFSKQELQEILEVAKRIGVQAVVECSVPEELDVALSCDVQVLLLNNRPISLLPEDPKNSYFKGSVDNAGKFWNDFSEVRDFKSNSKNILISASCISSKEDIMQISKFPYDAALVGNAASSNVSPAKFIASLIET